jgi:hypothetical protein
MRGRGVGFSVGDKCGFFALGQDDMLCLLGMISGFQPNMGVSHDDLGTNFILEATNKSFPKEIIYHALHLKSQVLKGSNKIFHYSILFQLGQMS